MLFDVWVEGFLSRFPCCKLCSHDLLGPSFNHYCSCPRSKVQPCLVVKLTKFKHLSKLNNGMRYLKQNAVQSINRFG